MFKYSAFTEYSLMNILNDELYMNHYESFNDPFECRCEILTGFPTKESNTDRLKDIINAWGFEDHDDPVALENYENLVLSLEETEPDVLSLIDTARISCFSKRQDNLLMWAHYANGLRGFCLEFDKDLILSETNNAEIFEVLYDRNPSTIDSTVLAVLNDQVEYHEDAIYATEGEIKYTYDEEKKAKLNEEIQFYQEHLNLVYLKNREIYQKMLANKSLEWHYEEELRIILPTNIFDKSGVFMKYPLKSLKSITIGEKMPEQQRKALLEIIRSKSEHIIINTASRLSGQFGVEICKFS